MLGRAASKYFRLLNADLAKTVLRGTRGAFRSSLASKGTMGAMKGSAKTLGRGAGFYFWNGATTAQRAARISTAAGGAFLAGNFINPRNNFGPF